MLKEHLDFFKKSGFAVVQSFYDAGIMYIEDTNVIAICPFGSNLIQIKCKSKNCEQGIKLVENTILVNFS